MAALFTLTMTMILLSHPTQRRRLLLLSWEPSGFACVNHKERDNLPANQPKDESHKLLTTTTATTATTTTTTTTTSIRVFLIHSFPALACNCTLHY